jgi:hypothetical protein
MSERVEVRLGRTLSETYLVGQDINQQIKRVIPARVTERNPASSFPVKEKHGAGPLTSKGPTYSSAGSVLFKPKSANSPSEAIPPPASEE